MTTLTITHTHTEGTLIDGTSRGDGSADALKANRWRWSRNLGSWYIPSSRDHDARSWQIETTASQLREAGFEVEIEVENTARPTAEVEADKAARAADRAAALDAKAAWHQSAADAHHAAADQISSGIPFGQPILVGHHSEGRARRDAAKIHTNMRKAIDAGEAAREAERKANAARVNTRPKHPSTTANRLDKLRAELRKLERQQRPGYTVASGPEVIAEVSHKDLADTPHMEQLREQITYWEGVRAQQIADGKVLDTSAAKPGDLVQVRGGTWWRIKRTNTKTLTLESGGCSIRAQRHQVTALRPGPDAD